MSTVLMWVAFFVGLGAMTSGAVALTLRRRQWAAAVPTAWTGLFLVAETVPRLAKGSAGLVLTASVLAIVPLLLGLRAAGQPHPMSSTASRL